MQQDPRILLAIGGAIGLALSISIGVALGNLLIIPLGLVLGVLAAFIAIVMAG